jgi:vancomycin resistance protein YoaR
VSGVLLFIFVMVGALAGYQFIYQDKIYPGVSSVYGVNLAGMTQNEARTALAERFTYDEEARFIFYYEGQTWEFTAAELGVSFDVEATVNAAYAVGRNEGMVGNLIAQFNAWRGGEPVVPIITYNRTLAEQSLDRIARDYINRPVLDATISIQGGRGISTPSQVGRSVDVPATLGLLEQEILNLSQRSEFNMVVRETAPQIWDTQAIAAQINLALDSRGVTFYVDDQLGLNAGPWTALSSDIENMLRIERVDDGNNTAHYELNLNDEQVRQFLVRIAPDLRKDPVNARLIFNDQTKELEVIQPSQTGRELNIATTLPQFYSAVFSPDNRNVRLDFAEVPPTIPDTVTARELGITELIQSATTYYLGSNSSRVTNIQIAASRFHGVVIPPNSEFSFNEWLGDVSLDTGYEEALIIYGDQTIRGVGGGVCQVSSTIFQAAFYAGFPILERYPHAYRVGYYEVGEGPGMDATVYEPIVDFRFMNDTPYHLLLETYVVPGSSSVSFRLYSTDTGRQVIKEGPYIRNVRAAPPPKYVATPGLSPGSVIQVDYAVSGADVYVYRTVKDAEGNILINREEYFSGYVPWPAQFQVAPGDSRAG